MNTKVEIEKTLESKNFKSIYINPTNKKTKPRCIIELEVGRNNILLIDKYLERIVVIKKCL